MPDVRGQRRFPIGPLVAFLMAASFVVRAGAAEPALEVHGMADVFSSGGAAIAWAVLRGASEETTLVTIRVAADSSSYPWVSVRGSDPFTREQRALLQATANAGVLDVRAPRARFADFPRTELRFYDSAPHAQSDSPALVVFYLGVPDTTPEFATGDKLDAYLTDRIAKLGVSGGSKPR
jgi:hypothetical protein